MSEDSTLRQFDLRASASFEDSGDNAHVSQQTVHLEGCPVTSELSTSDVAACVVSVGVLCFVDTVAAQLIATMDHMTGLNSLSVHPLEPN